MLLQCNYKHDQIINNDKIAVCANNNENLLFNISSIDEN